MEFKDLSEEEKEKIWEEDGYLVTKVDRGLDKNDAQVIIDDLKNISTTTAKAYALLDIMKYGDERKEIVNYIVNSDLEQLYSILKNGNDDEKIHLIKTIIEECGDDNQISKYSIINVGKSLQSEDKKIEMLGYIKNESLIAGCASMHFRLSDEGKTFVIDNMLKDEGEISYVVASLKSDEKKLEYLSQFQDEDNMKDVLISLDSDDKKLEYLSRFQDEHNMKEVVTSLKSEDKVVKCLSKFQDEEIKKEIIEDWLYDKQMEALQYINDERFKKRITKEIQERQDEKNLKEEQSQKQNTEQEDELNLEELSLEELSNMSQNLDNEIKKTDDAIEEERKKLIATVLEKRSLLKAKQKELNELKQKNNEFKEQSQGQDLDQ